jgi:hypothetical protein
MITSNKSAISDHDFQRAIGYGCADYNIGCPDGTYYDSDNGVCSGCAVGCATCDESGTCLQSCDDPCTDCVGDPDTCLKCDRDMILLRGRYSSYYYYPASIYFGYQTCVKSCDDLVGFYYNRTTKACEACPSGCDYCENSTICLECSFGLYLQEYFMEDGEIVYSSATSSLTRGGGRLLNDAEFSGNISGGLFDKDKNKTSSSGSGSGGDNDDNMTIAECLEEGCFENNNRTTKPSTTGTAGSESGGELNATGGEGEET